MFHKTFFFGLIASCVSVLSSSDTASADEEHYKSFDHIMVEQEGQGRPIVFVPGLSSSPDVFDDGISSIEGHIHKVYISGFAGREPPQTSDAVVEPIADELSQFIDTNDLKDVVLVGHSMGGIVSMLVARQSDRIAKILVVDAVPFLPGLFNPAATPESAAAMRPGLRAQMDATSDAQYLAFVREGLVRQAISNDSREYVFADVEGSNLKTVKTAFIELMSNDYSYMLDQISADVTVLVPFDPATGFQKEQVRAIYEAQYAGLPNVDIRIIDGSRHFIMLDSPESFGRELSTAVNQISWNGQ